MANKIAPALEFFREIAEDLVSNVKNMTTRTSTGREKRRPSAISPRRSPPRRDWRALPVPTPATHRLQRNQLVKIATSYHLIRLSYQYQKEQYTAAS
uniref:Uncharacterized protein n=1 Tax=Acrobeloides nanus TaxID=290746 RepID=A0A914D4D7_9BILA